MEQGRVALCGQILQEVLQGSRDPKAFESLSREMSIWKSEAEEPDDFRKAARIFAELRWKGLTVPPTECLIAAVAIRRKMPLFTTDSDFGRIPGLTLFDLAEEHRAFRRSD